MDLLKISDKLSHIGINVYSVGGSTPQLHFDGFRFKRVAVFGSTGPKLWQFFHQFLRLNPGFLANNKHPLDMFVRQYLERELQDLHFESGLSASPWTRWQSPSLEHYQWAQCSILNNQFADFRLLAESANLGYRSPLGMLIHPKYGLWMGLRLALFTTATWKITELSESNPCVPCDKPCISSCPTNAISETQGWNMPACYEFHRQDSTCHTGCLSRVACPIGSQFQYPNPAILYHHNKLVGRKHLARDLGEPSEGVIDMKIDLMPWQSDKSQ